MSDNIEIQELNDDDLEAASGGAPSLCCCSTTGGHCSNKGEDQIAAAR